MISEFNNYMKKNRQGLIFYFLVLLLLIITLIVRYYYLGIYPFSLFLIYLLFVLTQHFDFEYKYLIGPGILFLIICFFLIIFRPKFELDYLYIHSRQMGLAAQGFYIYHRMADYFANYAFGFLIFGTVSLLLDNFKKRFLKIFKIIFLSIIILMLAVFPIVIYFNSDCKIAVKDINILVGSKIKEVYLKTFNKNLYYSKEDKDIKVFIDFPREGESISGIAKISGAAIDINSNLNPGIDKVEIFLGGNAPEGELIKRLSYKDMAIGIDGSKKTISYINNIYIQFFNRRPSAAEFNYWIINLEYGIYSYYDVARSILDSYEFRRRELSDQYFLELIYKGLFNRAYDTAGLTYWLDQMKGGLDQDAIIDNFIDSEEFKIPVDEYYKIVNIKKDPLSIFRKEVGDKYGKQFYLSGFDVNFDSTKFKNGDYELYIYARSPLFGWDFKKVNICINN